MAGDLKLAYAQFEELETFARFGARLDEDTRKIIEHGQRIRACLKQSEFAPVSVPGQIAVLLALTSELFDRIPIDRITEAEHAVQEVAANIPADLTMRFNTTDTLSDEDRATIVRIARSALMRFQSKPNSNLKAKAGSKAEANTKTEPKPQRESEPEAHTEAEPQPKPEPKVKS